MFLIFHMHKNLNNTPKKEMKTKKQSRSPLKHTFYVPTVDLALSTTCSPLPSDLTGLTSHAYQIYILGQLQLITKLKNRLWLTG